MYQVNPQLTAIKQGLLDIGVEIKELNCNITKMIKNQNKMIAVFEQMNIVTINQEFDTKVMDIVRKNLT